MEQSISQRRTAVYCKEGRIEGAALIIIKKSKITSNVKNEEN